MVEKNTSGELPTVTARNNSSDRAVEHPVGAKGPVVTSKIYERVHLAPEHIGNHATMLFNQRSQLPPSDLHLMIGVEKPGLITQRSKNRANRFAPRKKHGDPEIEGGGGPAI